MGSGAMKHLFKRAMEGDWEQVVNLCKEHPEVQKAKITRSGNTALHLAVSDRRENVVEQLLEQSSNEALKAKNERGNTPLHIAASLGNARMCNCIASKDPKVLIGVRNNDNETPFFLAALHGKKDAFLCLHYLCGGSEQGYLHCRRNDGETVLHSAISGEYFDLAFEIIHKYERLVNCVNEQGFSPLHLLATKPAAFKSGTHLRSFNRIIYHCIFVDELKVDDDPSKSSEERKKPTYPDNYHTCISKKPTYPENYHTCISKKPTYPENYHTCISFFGLLLNIYRVLVPGGTCKQRNDEEADTKGQVNSNQQGNQSSNQTDGHQLFPINYAACFNALKLISKGMLIILGSGYREIRKIRGKKEKHTWSVQVMNELLKHASMYEYDHNAQIPQHLSSHKDDETTPYSVADGGNTDFSTDSITSPEQITQQMSMANSSSEANQSQGEKGNGKNGDAAGEEKKNTTSDAIGERETPLLVAAKNGITEMVERILELFPVAIEDMNTDKKNVVLLAVENRQPHVYKLLLKRDIMKDSIFGKVDSNGNSALHLAAKLGEHHSWRIPGAALQMQWEMKWYQFVKNSMPTHFFTHHNKDSETAKDVFKKSHVTLLKDGGKWLTSTSQSCSVVAALIATVAFATSSTVPGGVEEGKGTPTLEREPAFNAFAISSLVALCFSVTSMIMFLAILTSRYQEKDFVKGLPWKLLLGLTSLFLSITSMLISFCAGHFFVLRDELKFGAFPVYAVTCLPVTFFAAVQFPLYFDLIRATLRKVPQRSYKAVPL